jgi:hypothetical protein
MLAGVVTPPVGDETGMCGLSIWPVPAVDGDDMPVPPSGPHPPQRSTNAHVAILMGLVLQVSVTRSASTLHREPTCKLAVV